MLLLLLLFNKHSILSTDTPCEVKELKTDEYIKCEVASKPASITGSRFSGNRGLRYETWTISKGSLTGTSQIRDLTSSASGYQQRIIDETYVSEDTVDNYVSRMKFYYVPKHSGKYVFYLFGDDYAELFIDDVSIVCLF